MDLELGIQDDQLFALGQAFEIDGAEATLIRQRVVHQVVESTSDLVEDAYAEDLIVHAVEVVKSPSRVRIVFRSSPDIDAARLARSMHSASLRSARARGALSHRSRARS